MSENNVLGRLSELKLTGIIPVEASVHATCNLIPYQRLRARHRMTSPSDGWAVF